jgi:signal transduction histidine kinase
VQLQAAERLSLKRPQQAVHSLQEARELARESLQEARRSVFNLRPTGLETQALDQALAQHLKQFEARSKLETDFVVEGYPRPLDLDVRQHLYRITQEALTNVTRHAEATQVGVTLTFASKTVTLTIADNGVGLNGRNGSTNDQSSRENLQGGFGLVGIQERVNLMKGEVTFDAPENGGTYIKVVLPK